MAGIAIAAIGYSCIIPISAFAWKKLLADMGIRKNWGELGIIMSITQLAKYVPGNVGQHIGRAAMSVTRGIPVQPYTISVVAEAVLAVIAAAVVGMLGCGLAGMSGESLKLHGMSAWPYIAGLVAASILALVATKHLLPRLRRRQLAKHHVSRMRVLLPRNRTFGCALALYILNYVVFGSGITAMVLLILPSEQAHWLLLVGAFALAWVVGFFTPGAPAGLGVREVLMVTLLQFSYSKSDALLIVIALRLATTVGDIFCFATGMAADALHGKRRAANTLLINTSDGDDHET
jgi:hypothetical protein